MALGSNIAQLKNTPGGKVASQLFLAPALLAAIAILVVSDHNDIPDAGFMWIFWAGLVGYGTAWLRFAVARQRFLAYYRAAMSCTALLCYGIALGAWQALNKLNSALATSTSLSCVAVLFLAYTIYSFSYGQRVCWKNAVPHHLSQGDIDPEGRVDLMARLGYDTPFQARLTGALDKGWQTAIISFFAGLTVLVNGRHESAHQWLMFGALLGTGLMCVFATSRLFWSSYYLSQYERERGLQLTIKR